MIHASEIGVAGAQAARTLCAFAGYGLELEYMLVAQDTLDVLPVADEILRGTPGQNQPGELVHGTTGWSNELVAHVVEAKNIWPTLDLERLQATLQQEIVQMNALLAERGGRLMAGGMHPWMNPLTETRLWPHANAAIYETYDRIFDCRAHGWANVQSTHINLPFANDAEFARLHAAVRLVVPIIPAIAASSPFADGRAPGPLDYRMEAYRTNALAVPSLTGEVVPETVTSRAEYERAILHPMYHDIAPHDPDGVLRHEWLNSRGAIARFSRNAIEIRVMDVQECPRADVSLAAIVIDVVRALYEERFAPLFAQHDMPTDALVRIFRECVNNAEGAQIADSRYLSLFGMRTSPCAAGALWWRLADRVKASGAPLAGVWEPVLEWIFTRGTLARRLLDTLGAEPSRTALAATYRALCDALAAGCLLKP